MLFPTMSFAMFFVVVLGVSWRLNDRPGAWKLFVLGASYYFYAAWDWRFLGLIILSTVVNEVLAIGVFGADGKRKRAILIAAVVFNLGLLGYFKYANFFMSGLQTLLGPFGLAPSGVAASVVLPIGISFFTFQGLSYVIDVYRGDNEPYALGEVALYLGFFPHLVAGPIVRASEFVPQLRHRRNPEMVDVSRAVRLIARGMVKKVLVATMMATLVDPVFATPGRFGAITTIVAIWAYAIQIYADFSGYTDMAIGIALLMGFKFPQNFDRPYNSATIQEFWRRWHITLSRWLRDYLYIPLGGNRGGMLAENRNLIITMALGGLWHGASGVFIFWGLYHGVGLALERVLLERRKAGLPGGLVATAFSKVSTARQRARAYQAEVDLRDSGVGAGAVALATTTGSSNEATRLYGEDPAPSTRDARRGGRGAGAGAGRSGGSAGAGGGDNAAGGGEGRIGRWVRRNTGEIPFDEEWQRLRASLEAQQKPKRLRSLMSKFLVVQFVCIGWVFFRAPDMGTAFDVFGRVFTGWTSGEMAVTAIVVVLIIGSIVAQFVPTTVGDALEYRFSILPPIAQALLFAGFLALVQMLSPTGVAPFIYFQF